jgi:capsular polysaccharide transport system permease protein
MKRSSLEIQKNVIYALLIRETKTRFGKDNLGYWWSVLEPSMQVLIFWALFSLMNRMPSFEAEVPLFLLTGIFTWYTHRKIVAQVSNAISANTGLFQFHHVKIFDTLVARFFLESLIFFGAFLLLWLLFSYFGFQTNIHQPLELMCVYILFLLFSFGWSLLIMALHSFIPESAKVTAVFYRFVFFCSCVFYGLDTVPDDLRPFFLMNPMVHYLELIRIYFFENYQSYGVNLGTAFLYTLVTLFLGLATLRTIQSHVLDWERRR